MTSVRKTVQFPFLLTEPAYETADGNVLIKSPFVAMTAPIHLFDVNTNCNVQHESTLHSGGPLMKLRAAN